MVVAIDERLTRDGIRHRLPPLTYQLCLQVGVKIIIDIYAPNSFRALVTIGIIVIAGTVRLCTGERVKISRSFISSILIRTTFIVQIIAGITELIWVIEVVPGKFRIEVDLSFSILTFLGRDKDDTIVGARAIDGRSTGILHHLHRLDIIGVDVSHTAADHTIHDDQRRTTTIIVSTTTQRDCRCRIRVT